MRVKKGATTFNLPKEVYAISSIKVLNYAKDGLVKKYYTNMAHLQKKFFEEYKNDGKLSDVLDRPTYFCVVRELNKTKIEFFPPTRKQTDFVVVAQIEKEF